MSAQPLTTLTFVVVIYIFILVNYGLSRFSSTMSGPAKAAISRSLAVASETNPMVHWHDSTSTT